MDRQLAKRLRSRDYSRRRRMLLESLERRSLLATFNVNVFDDELDLLFDANDLSLREAIQAANSSPGADTIQLPNGTYTLSILGSGEDANATGDLDITESLTIIGTSGARDSVIIDAAQIDRALHFNSVNGIDVFRVENLTVQNGLVEGFGGGIAVFGGDVTFQNMVARSNRASNVNNISDSLGGGIYVSTESAQLADSLIADNLSDDDGGGLGSQSDVVGISNTTFQNNEAGLDGGGASFLNESGTSINISTSIFLDNHSGARNFVGAGTGGGLSIKAFKLGPPGSFTPTQLTMIETVIRNNRAFDSGGGIYAIDTNVNMTGSTIDANDSLDAGGGALFEYDETDPLALSANVSNSFFANNTSVNGGGGLLFREVTATIQGGSFTGNRVTGLGNEFGDGGGGLTLTADSIASNRNASVSGALFDNNEAASAGAIAIVNVLTSISNVTISNNRATFNGAGGGGAIGAVGVVNSSTPTLILTDSIVTGNTSAGVGAGGIGLLTATAEIKTSEITNNSATNTVPNPQLGIAGVGGGIGSIGDGTLPSIKIAQSLIANNNAVNGGGIFATNNAVVIENSTISGNTSSDSGESIINGQNGTFEVSHSTIFQGAVTLSPQFGVINANNAANSFTFYNSIIDASFPSNPNGTGLFESSGFNLDSDGSLGLTSPSDQSNVRAQLLPLANNGGTTRTHALAGTSPARDRGDPNSSILIDQRGVTRPIDGDGNSVAVNDIGAFEAPVASPSIDLAASLTGSAANAIPGQQFTYTVSVTNSGASNATNVIATDTLPAGLTFVSGSGSGVTVTSNAGVVTANLGTLAPLASKSFTIVVLVASNVVSSIVNSVSVAATETDPNSGNNQSTLTTPVTPRYDLGITKIDSVDPISPGASFSYTLVVTNSGPSDALNVVVSDAIPSALSIESVNAPPSGIVNQASNVVTVTFSSFPAGASRTIVISVIASPSAVGTISNTATVQAVNAPSNQETNLPNNAATQTTTVSSSPSVDLNVAMTDTPDPVSASSNLTYNVTIRNLSSVTATDISALLLLDPLVSFVNAIGTFTNVIPTGDQVTFEIASIPGGGTFNFSVVVFVSSAATDTVTSSLEVFPTETDSNTINNKTTVVTNVGAAALRDVAITQNTVSPFADPGQPLIYVLQVTNNSSISVSGVQLAFDGSNDLGINSVVVSNGGTSNPPTSDFTVNLGTLSAGQVVTVTVNGIVLGSASSALTNTATVSIPGGDDNSNNNTTGATLPLQFVLGRGTRGITATNFDGRAGLDLAVINEFSNDLLLLSNVGQGGFFAVEDRITLAGRPRSIVSNDNLDAAGSVIAIADVGIGQNPGAVFVYKNRTLSEVKAGSGPVDVAIDKFNDNNTADLAVLTLRSNQLEIVLDGNSKSLPIATIRNPVAVATADVDGQKLSDIIVASHGFESDDEGLLSVYINDGQGGFSLGKSLPIPQDVSDVVTANIDGKGSSEIITVSTSGKISVYSYVDGATPQLVERQTLTTDPDISYVKAADINGDGRFELLVTNISDDSLSIFYANASDQLVLGATVSGLSNPSAITTGDFDLDGVIDIIVPSYFVKPSSSASAVSYSYFSSATRLSFSLQSPSPSITSSLVTTQAIGTRVVETPFEIDPALFATTAARLAFDTNEDQQVTPLDALLVINSIQSSMIQASGESSSSQVGFERLDVNRDGKVTPLDALLVINELNQLLSPSPESNFVSIRKEKTKEELEVVDLFFGDL